MSYRQSMKYLLIWLPVALFSLYVKYALVEWDGFRLLARYLGYVDVSGLTVLEKLSLFRLDLLVGFLIIPGALLLVGSLFRPALRSIFAVIFSMACLITLYIQLRSFYAVGRFLSVDMLRAAVQWSIENPEYVAQYQGLGSLLKLFVLITLIIAAGGYAMRSERTANLPITSTTFWRRGRQFVLFCVIFTIIISWSVRVPTTLFHQGVLFKAFKDLTGAGEVDYSAFLNKTPVELEQDYRELSNAPLYSRDFKYWNKANGFNLIFFVLETAPAQCISLEGTLDDFPTLRKLKKKSFIGLNHYSTYPYTNRAIFSLLSSWYPSNQSKNFSHQYKDFRAPSVVRALTLLGYQSGFYFPQRQIFENDEQLYQQLGVTQQHYPFPKQLNGNPGELDWKVKVAKDLAALDLLKHDISRWTSAHQRFVAAFFPQIGHAPWPDLKGGGNITNTLTLGHNILALQDSWVGEIVSILKKTKSLANTIIVVTADHGLRTKQEYPPFNGGMIDEISFHVPLLIYVPQILKTTQYVSGHTSHIDIKPTVLDLLGVTIGRDYEQGTPIWDQRLQMRTTFFFANHYLGADAYYEDGCYYMWSHVSDAIYVSDERLHFTTDMTIPISSKIRIQVISKINKMTALQHAWARLLIRKEQLLK